MPDSIGFPTVAECMTKLVITAKDDVSREIQAEITHILPSVIAEFQSPVGRNNQGGTGRRFAPLATTKLYDGNGFQRLTIDDIVPGTSFSVSIYGSVSGQVLLEESPNGGLNVLAFPLNNYTVGIASSGYYFYGFPIGVQNVAVTATFGYAASIPADIFEAIRCEVTSRALSQGFVDLAGAGEAIKIVDFEDNTSAGVSVWGLSSPLATMHTIYVDCVTRYRLSNAINRRRILQRMS